jgi:hypothetical protein
LSLQSTSPQLDRPVKKAACGGRPAKSPLAD